MRKKIKPGDIVFVTSAEKLMNRVVHTMRSCNTNEGITVPVEGGEYRKVSHLVTSQFITVEGIEGLLQVCPHCSRVDITVCPHCGGIINTSKDV